VIELLSACPRLKVLVTSRAALRVAGEHEFLVPSLQIPDQGRWVSPEELAAYPAVALFVQRARAVRADFALEERSAPAVADICRRLDGVPLAIELAAARARALAVEQIAARLDDCFALLTEGHRTAPTRQQTLRATLDWSHDLLPPAERELFRRLAVFAGGWTLDAAEAVYPSPAALDALTGLVDQSLIVSEQHGPVMRYRMLEPIRLYAQERLAESDEGVEAAELHAAYVLRLAEEAETLLSGPAQGTWVDRLELELANVRAALHWFCARGDPEWRGLRLASALWRFWWMRSYFAEGRGQLRALLDVAGESAPAGLRARGLQALGQLAFRQGDRTEAQDVLEQALAAARESGDQVSISLALRSLGRLAIDAGQHREARRHLEAALEIERSLDHRAGLPWTLTYLGWVALFDGDAAEATTLLEEGLVISRAIEDREGIGRLLFSLAHVEMDRGELGTARTVRREPADLLLRARLQVRAGVRARGTGGGGRGGGPAGAGAAARGRGRGAARLDGGGVRGGLPGAAGAPPGGRAGPPFGGRRGRGEGGRTSHGARGRDRRGPRRGGRPVGSFPS
jgi:predicted ATPase